MLGVARFVEERAPVVGPAHGLDHEDDPARHLDRRAERAGRLLLALLDVELDVRLARRARSRARPASLRARAPCPRTGSTGSHSAARTSRGESQRCASESETPDALAEELVQRVLVQPLGVVEQPPALLGELVEPEPEAAMQLDVVRRSRVPGTASRRIVEGLEVDRVEMLVAELAAHLFERLPLGPVGLVGDRRAQHPVRQRLPVDGRRDRRLELARPSPPGS